MAWHSLPDGQGKWNSQSVKYILAKFSSNFYNYGLVKDCSNSIANATDLLQSCNESLGMHRGFAPLFWHLDYLITSPPILPCLLFHSDLVGSHFESPPFSACRRSFCPQNWTNPSFYPDIVGSHFELWPSHPYWFWSRVPPPWEGLHTFFFTLLTYILKDNFTGNGAITGAPVKQPWSIWLKVDNKSPRIESEAITNRAQLICVHVFRTHCVG